MSPPALKHEATGPARPRRVRFDIGPRDGALLPVPSRRALALFRAADLGADLTTLDALALYAGAQGDPATTPRIDSPACDRLAAELEGAGYPLTDDGIRRFKLERGHSGVVRLGPEIAPAYAQLLAGRDARLDIPPEVFQALPVTARRAARILVLASRYPNRLEQAQAFLTPGRPKTRTVDLVLAERLVRCAQSYGLSFTNAGMQQLAVVAALPGTRLSAPLARYLVDLLTAPDEPAHDYRRAGCAGHVLNQRTYEMMLRAQTLLEATLEVAQGSYLGDTLKGAHPHQGGGVVDLTVVPRTPEYWVRAVVALRRVGFAAWFRDREDEPHIHAIAIGDRELAPSAAWQVGSFFKGLDGRSRALPDPHARLSVELPAWSRKYRIPHV